MNRPGAAADAIPRTLPNQLEHLFEVLSQLYATEGKRDLQEIVVNATYRVGDETEYDNWDGGITGYNLFLSIPSSLYVPILRKAGEVGTKIKEDLNAIKTIEREYVASVQIEMLPAGTGNWRGGSGLLLDGTRHVARDAEARIWVEGYRVFLSHKSEVKVETAKFKEDLAKYGVSAFVAHEDIHPTKVWQDEIENALASCDAFVALLTKSFHESDWTDQEVGYAVARGIPIIAVRLGRDPYGFIGKFQGLRSDWDSAPFEIAKLLIKEDRMVAAYIQAVAQSRNFVDSNKLADLLPSIEKLSANAIDDLVNAHNGNLEVWGSFGFEGGKYSYPGLVKHLNRILGDKIYEKTADGHTIGKVQRR
jgi:hypothetical protein